MFRSLFGTTAAGEYGSAGAAGGGGGKPSGPQSARKGAPPAVSVPTPSKDGGGFFQLEPTNASGGEIRGIVAIVTDSPRCVASWGGAHLFEQVD